MDQQWTLHGLWYCWTAKANLRLSAVSRPWHFWFLWSHPQHRENMYEKHQAGTVTWSLDVGMGWGRQPNHTAELSQPCSPPLSALPPASRVMWTLNSPHLISQEECAQPRANRWRAEQHHLHPWRCRTQSSLHGEECGCVSLDTVSMSNSVPKSITLPSHLTSEARGNLWA